PLQVLRRREHLLIEIGRIDLRQSCTLLNLLPFLDQHLRDDPAGAEIQAGILRGLDLATAAHALDKLAARDGGRSGGGRAGLATAACQRQAKDANDQNGSETPLHGTPY